MDTSFLFQNCYTGTDFENLMVQFLGEHGFRAKKTGSCNPAALCPLTLFFSLYQPLEIYNNTNL